MTDVNGTNGLATPITVRPISLTRAQATAPTADLWLWWLIQAGTESLSFKNYQRFMDLVLCGDKGDFSDEEVGPIKLRHDSLSIRRYLPFTDTDAYRLLKIATEAFVTVNCSVFPDPATLDNIKKELNQVNLNELGRRVNSNDADITSARTAFLDDYLQLINGTTPAQVALPYLAQIRSKLPDVPIKTRIFNEAVSTSEGQRCYGILQDKLTLPCMLELIWSYWHEQGMLVQTMNAVSLRFQNIRGSAENDPLAMMEFDPLRPLNNLLWGHVQDEQHRLSLVRRAYEYDHHYGLTLEGKAVPQLRPADSRSKFIEAFHNLLYEVSMFYKQDDDTTVIADGFPVLNALKEVHLLLSEGAHNQFGDLPATARIEMLMQQWLLARPEFREALPTRTMVALPEAWMDRVDAMRRLQGWGDTSVMHFRNLGIYGEQILLSVRYGAWSDVNDPTQAAIWARFWRAQIQGYVHAYRAVTGVELVVQTTTSQQAAMRVMQPSALLRQRLPGASAAALPAASGTNMPMPFRERKTARNS